MFVVGALDALILIVRAFRQEREETSSIRRF